MINERNILGAVVFIALLLTLGLGLTGCSFKVEALYHGETPIGISDTKATQLRAQPLNARVVKAKEEDRF